MNNKYSAVIEGIYKRSGVSDPAEYLKAIDKISKVNSSKSFTGDGYGISSHYGTSGIATVPLMSDSNELSLALTKEMTRTIRREMNDSDYMFDIPSSGVPAAFTTIFTTQMIQQLFKKTTLTEITDSFQQGVQGVEQIQIPVSTFAGDTELYSDFNNNANTAVNFNWIPRNIIYFQNAINYGEMQQAQFSLAKIDYAGKLRESKAIVVSQNQNNIGFKGFGNENSQIFGILNEPNLKPAFQLPPDGKTAKDQIPTTRWICKTHAQILRDLRMFWGNVIASSAGNVDYNSKAILCLPPSAYIALTTPNEMSSISVMKFIKDAYPNMEVKQIPDFDTEGAKDQEEAAVETSGYLMVEHPNGELPFAEIFVNKWIGHRPMIMSSSISEKISYGLGGVILKYSFLVAHTVGI